MGYTSYKDIVKSKMEEAAETALEATGLEAQRDVTLRVTSNKQVDTGRMRASVTYIAGEKLGGIQADLTGVLHSEDKPSGSLPYNTLHVGTNVDYAIFQEKTNPFLEPTIKNNLTRYKDMANDIFAKLLGGE